ncbi:hypothetical protein [Streptomyces sp. NPDC004682]
MTSGAANRSTASPSPSAHYVGLGLRHTDALLAFALAAWRRGDLAEIPVGSAWDVVRLPRALGWKAVGILQQQGITVGPAQHTPDGVEVLVPLGSAAAWELPDAEVLAPGSTVCVPHPSTVAPHTQRAHSWIVPPHGDVLTDADMLHEAYAAALTASHMDAVR